MRISDWGSDVCSSDLVDASVRRLYAMVNAAQRLDHDTADMIDAPRMAVNVTDVVGDILYRYRETLGDRNIRLIRVLEENALVWSGAGVIDIAFENILSNAISFSPADRKSTRLNSRH